jgi:uncharacterized membrane protein
MENWLVLGFGAALAYAISGIATKLAIGKRYMALDVTTTALLTTIGVAIGFIAFYVFFQGLKAPNISPVQAAVGISVGLFWAAGSILVYYGLLKGADVSRMAPIYNMNTLLVVLGGILLLHELPDRSQVLRVLFGALLIVVGGLLVST